MNYICCNTSYYDVVFYCINVCGWQYVYNIEHTLLLTGVRVVYAIMILYFKYAKI